MAKAEGGQPSIDTVYETLKNYEGMIEELKSKEKEAHSRIHELQQTLAMYSGSHEQKVFTS